MQIAIELPWARRSGGSTLEIPDIDLASRVSDIARAGGDGADSFGVAATEFGREAFRLGKDAARLSREAVRRGLLLAVSGSKSLRRASTDAAATIEDLRSYQIVRKRQGPDWRPGIALIAGAGAGLAAMYLLDPEQGRRRRVQLMDAIHKYARTSGKRLNSTAHDLRNRSQGLAAEARKAVDQARGETSYYQPQDGVMGTSDGSDQPVSAEWPAEPATSEAHRS